jgi:hypothetical protein
MFLGYFSYDKKGPYHIWQSETAAERKKADQVLVKLNEEFEPIMQAQWELNSGMGRLGLRNRPGKSLSGNGIRRMVSLQEVKVKV